MSTKAIAFAIIFGLSAVILLATAGGTYSPNSQGGYGYSGGAKKFRVFFGVVFLLVSGCIVGLSFTHSVK